MLYFRRENWENIFENVYEESAETLRMGEIFFFPRENREKRSKRLRTISLWTRMHRRMCAFLHRPSMSKSDFEHSYSFQKGFWGKFLLAGARRYSTEIVNQLRVTFFPHWSKRSKCFGI